MYPIVIVDFADKIGIFQFESKDDRERWVKMQSDFLKNLNYRYGKLDENDVVHLEGDCCSKHYCFAQLLNSSDKETEVYEVKLKLSEC